MKRAILLTTHLTCMALVTSAFAGTDACVYSKIWGENGDDWKAEQILPDFSYAGYHAGERGLPEQGVQWNFKSNFGAKGDGIADDTKALETALDKIQKGVLYFPEGKYVFSKKIDLKKGSITFRGAGAGKTFWVLTKSLSDLYGYKSQEFHKFSEWSFGPGLINVIGPDPITPKTLITRVLESQIRGTHSLVVTSSKGLKVGQWIRLVESDPPSTSPSSGSLIKFLYGEVESDSASLNGAKNIVRFLSRIKYIRKRKGNAQIILERNLPYDVRLDWNPEIHRFSPEVEEVGFEDLSMEFPWTAYPGHFKERGYNALFLKNVANCWVKNVEIINSDFGVSLNGTDFCTLTGINIKLSKNRNSEKASGGVNGHHGIDVSFGTENLVTAFNIKDKYHHDLSVEWYALHTVFSAGKGFDLNMDHHREANYSSLFSDLDCGLCSRPYESSGVEGRGFHAGAHSTFWNIHGGGGEIQGPAADFGPSLNFVGNFKIPKEIPLKWHYEQIHSGKLCPADLHSGMAARLRKR